MMQAQFCVRTVPGLATLPYQTNTGRSLPNSSLCCSSSSFSIRLGLTARRRRRTDSKFVTFSCKFYPGSSGSGSGHGGDWDHDYLEASLLLSETISHHRMRTQGFQEELKWHSFGQLLPISLRAKVLRPDPNSIEMGFLRRFQSPTIFLKISCDGDFLLPILVGDFAIEKLIDGLQDDDDNEDCPDQFQFVRNLVEKLGYEVKMVRITKRVLNTYYARLYFSKPGKNDILSVDARPSDAINVANRCKVPIYVNKQIVLADAIKIGYGTGRVRDKRPTYDVLLDSAADGRDFISEELSLVRKMDLAVKEERYNDAAMWRDKLMRLRNSSEQH